MGNTKNRQDTRQPARDHPHIHGEYHTRRSLILIDVGSPPHTWGILRHVVLASYRVGITPTYMGNTT